MSEDKIENGRLNRLENNQVAMQAALVAVEKRLDSFESSTDGWRKETLEKIQKIDDHIMSEAEKRHDAQERMNSVLAELVAKQHDYVKCPIGININEHVEPRVREVERANAVLTSRVALGGAIAFLLFSSALGWILKDLHLVTNMVQTVAAHAVK